MNILLSYIPISGSMFGDLFEYGVYEFEVGLGSKETLAVGTILEVPIPNTEKVAVLRAGKKQDREEPETEKTAVSQVKERKEDEDSSPLDRYPVDIMGVGNKNNGDIDQIDGSLFYDFVVSHWAKQ